MSIESLIWIVLFMPLFSAVGIGLFALRNEEVSANLSVGAITLGFVLSLFVFLVVAFQGRPPMELNYIWLSVGALTIQFGIQIDSLSLVMLLVVTGVGSMIHWYSKGYMDGDLCYSRYFASLSLFTFSMLGIVLSTNFVQMFIFWELVGVSSYLLIGFWHEKPSAADAAKKAFITNRLGDFGFILGILMVWSLMGSLNFHELKETLASSPDGLGGWATVAGILIFFGAVGKSAQFPLHVWLPDAMEGPTPVSALIHAATMVAAGVYMLCRVFFLLSPETLIVIAWIGGITALLAALIATQQDDIKRILAYSTLSQLGYMIMAVGLAAPAAGMFHLTTHAFFKALLFLGAGSVIFALHHEQNIWKMGDLKERMPTTFWTFLIGTAALCGLPPLSGFFSKDHVLAAALSPEHGNGILFGIGVAVAALTTFYMLRLFLVAFLGRAKSESSTHANESPSVMTAPLVVLAVFSVIGGFLGIEPFISKSLEVAHGADHAGASLAIAFSLFAIVFGGSLSCALYWNATSDPLPQRMGSISRAFRERFYLDEVYTVLINLTHEALSFLAAWIDRWIISGFLVRGTHGTTELIGKGLRLVQSGSLQTYAFLFVVGVAVVLYFMVTRSAQ